MIDTADYKKALDSGNRNKIIAEGQKMLAGTGLNALAPDAPNVNASKGSDNSAETKRYSDQFNKQALRLTATVDAYNDAVAAGKMGTPEAAEIQSRLQALESSDANLREIERIEADTNPNPGGGGLPEVGTPPWAVALQKGQDAMQKDITAIKNKLSA